MGLADPASLVLQLFVAMFPDRSCLIPSEGERTYFNGIVRNIGRSPLHNDFAKRDFDGWRISRIDQQLAWNIYLAVPGGDAGRTVIYKKSWTELDEAHKRQNAMGYEYSVVEDAERTTFEPVVGDLLIFRTTNYHEVTQTAIDHLRISIGGFIGIDDRARELLFWS